MTATKQVAPLGLFNVMDYGAFGNEQSNTNGATTAGSPVLTGSGFAAGDVGKEVCISSAAIRTDGAIASDLSMVTSITNGSATLTSSNNPFLASDVGKSVTIPGAGVSGADLVTTVSAYTNAGSVTLTDAASTTVTSVTFTLTRGTGTMLNGSGFTSADVGKHVLIYVPTTGTPSISSFVSAYISPTQVTLTTSAPNNTTLASARYTLATCEYHTILSYTDATHVTLADNAVYTLSGATYSWYNPDTAAFQAAITAANAAGGGVVTGPRKTYRIADVYLLYSNIAIQFPPDTTLRLAKFSGTNPSLIHAASANTSDAFFIDGNYIGCPNGWLRLDMSDQARLSTVPNMRGILMLNVRGCTFENIVGIGIPPNAGNTIAGGGNQALYGPTWCTFRNIRCEQVRDKGSSAVQMQGGHHCKFTVITGDGAVPFRIEMDNNAGDVCENIKAEVVYVDGSSTWGNSANAAVYLVGHHNNLKNVSVECIQAKDGADLISQSYDTTGTVGSVNDFSLKRGLVTGGGMIVKMPSTTNTFNGGHYEDLHGIGSLSYGSNYSGGNWDHCTVEGAALAGWQPQTVPNGNTNGPIARFRGCKALGNGARGWHCDQHSRVDLDGCIGADPNATGTTGSNLVPTNTYGVETNATGWGNLTNATVSQATAGSGSPTAPPAFEGTHMLQIASVANGATQVRSTAGTGGIAVTAGNSYVGQAYLRTASHMVPMYVGIRWWDGSGVFISDSVGAQVTPNTTNWSKAIVYATAPIGAAFASVTVNVTSTALAGEIYYSDAHTLFTTAGIPTQQYAFDVTAGCVVNVISSDLAGNGAGRFNGAGDVYEAQLLAVTT